MNELRKHSLLTLVSLIALLSGFLLTSCGRPAEPIRKFSFAEGDIVCFKTGGPKGVIAQSFHGTAQIRFYKKAVENGKINVGVGGAGLLSGGDGFHNNDDDKMFVSLELYYHELLREKDCIDR